jgi:Family of unknown function (DUF5832)
MPPNGLSLKLVVTRLLDMSTTKKAESVVEPVVEDFLDEDDEIPGQRYVLLSFLSPEKVLDKKDLFFFRQFLHAYEVDWKIKNLEKFLVESVNHINGQLDEKVADLEKSEQFDSAAICRKNKLSVSDIMSKYATFIQSNKVELNKTKINEAYEDFLYSHKAKLEEKFHAENDFHTTMRGVKIRGVYGNPKEAEIKAKKLQGKDKYHNIFMAEVGKWTPWDPSSYEVKDQEYNNDQLNSLMKKYKENEDSREKFFEERTKNSKSAFGGATPGPDAKPSDQFSNMFGNTGDLVLQRKLEKPNLTVERVEEALENVVVQPQVVQKVEEVVKKVEPAPQKVEPAAVPQKVEAAPQKVEEVPSAQKKNNRKAK